MARKKKLELEKHPGKPRGTEHLEVLNDSLPGSRLDGDGREIPSNEPMVLHLRKRTVTDLDQLRNIIQNIRATDGPIEFETFQEADDFDVEDDYGQFASQWEIPADGDDPSGPMPTAEEYVRWRQTGELPARFFPQDPPVSAGAPKVEPSSEPVQGSAPPA